MQARVRRSPRVEPGPEQKKIASTSLILLFNSLNSFVIDWKTPFNAWLSDEINLSQPFLSAIPTCTIGEDTSRTRGQASELTNLFVSTILTEWVGSEGHSRLVVSPKICWGNTEFFSVFCHSSTGKLDVFFCE